MDELSFWKQKLIQFFHDPPDKPFASYPGSGGHAKIAKTLFGHFTGETLRYYNRYPDWAAVGADRPMLSQPKEKGIAQVQLRWPKEPILTHPLCTAQMRVSFDSEHAGKARESGEALLEDQLAALEELKKEELPAWQDASALHRDFTRLWRRFRDELIAADPNNHHLWEEMPADGRVPDHSIWDHLRMTSALAFLPNKRGKKPLDDPEDPACPWLLRFTLHPAQRFIAEARTSRDLWIGSFLLADLTWHAMQPVIKQYGHDAIVYPDLRGNPLVDHWLADADPEYLPKQARDAGSFASLLPATFTAIAPHGAAGTYLKPIAELAEECADAVQKRWQTLANQVEAWLAKQVGSDGEWRKIWKRQHQNIIGCAWTAVAWLPPEPIKDPESLRTRALPAQKPGFRDQTDTADQKNIRKRKNRLAPWLPDPAWRHYELAREIYAHTHLNWHQMERGFDYALTHHQLGARHTLRRAQGPVEGNPASEPGEKCTCCGRRQALTNKFHGHIGQDRTAAKAFWAQSKELDPDETGNERLCGVCAMKRFLIVSGRDDEKQCMTGINPVWAGRDPDMQRQWMDRDHKPRVPFHSTATIAAQKFIAAVVENSDLRAELAEVVRTHRATGLNRTSFPRALPRLAAAANRAGGAARDFLELEAEEVLFPEALEGHRRGEQARKRQDDGYKTKDYESLSNAVQELRNKARELEMDSPDTRIAVLTMDGDSMGKLLLGDKERILATWRDVIHPKAVEQMLSTEKPRTRLHEAGWPDLLDARRLIGPSLHAYISRALASFSHTIVPWVVEREFSGRLIYAGGDDLLCLVPGDEALGLAARLQQVFSAPWVIDTRPDTDPWSWRKSLDAYDQTQARRRFAIPKFERDRPIELPISDADRLHPHVVRGEDGAESLPKPPFEGRVIPMLGGGQSLSAGIAYGHYKTPLRQLLRWSKNLLEQEAKERAERGAVALGYASRNGEKSRFAMRWQDGEDEAYECLTTMIDGFGNGGLPGRLPYKLRELAANVNAIREYKDLKQDRNAWIEELFRQTLGKADQKAAEAALKVWKTGLAQHPGKAERAVEGLLLCRSLAANEEERA